MHAASKGNAAFLFPDGVASPRNGTPAFKSPQIFPWDILNISQRL